MAQGNQFPPLPDGTALRKGAYTVERLLGTGGFAHVYLARDRSGKRVALKQCKASDAETTMQFGAEVAILQMLADGGKFFPAVFERFAETPPGAPDELPFVAMEYVPGTTLDKVLDTRVAQGRGCCAEPEVIGWTAQLLEALELAHAKGVVHRDVKPPNIMLLPDGKTIKIIDVGIAKVGGEGVKTEASGAGVSPGYSPPEQYVSRGGKTDYFSDIYAVGATMYQLLTGQLPAESNLRITGMEDLKPPRALNPQISPLAEGVILRALEMDVRLRFGSAREMRDTLLGKVVVKPLGPSTSRPLACPACGAGNKADARHCANCGAPLVFTFTFPQTGITVRTLTEFAGVCDTHWNDAISALMTGRMEQWLQARGAEGAAPLSALQAVRGRFPNDPNAQLEALLRALGAPAPTYSHNWREVEAELGLGLGPGATLRWMVARRGPATVTLLIRHTGRRGYLFGHAVPLVSWLDIRQPAFGCFSGSRAAVQVDVTWARRRLDGLRPQLIDLHFA